MTVLPEPVDVALRDGGTVRVRPVLASDADALRELLDAALRRLPLAALLLRAAPT